MRTVHSLLAAVTFVVPLAVACGGAAAPAAVAPSASGGAPTSAAAPEPSTASTGPLAAPGPGALPCTSDAECMTFKCNTQAGKCAMPCEHDSDCVAGAYCLSGVIPACVARHASTP